ncbi:hypothetical protein BDN67DRAFT_909623 [Paxillus ammoniavirescens]|nr:hypothetical protein BDN67DRAFT_909623 [Paxillus ammoniavirescens]
MFYHLPLLLPSDICDHTPCNKKLLEVEWSLCYTQANDALNECHTHIRLRQQLLQFKTQHVHGQGPSTHAQKTIQAVEDRLVLSYSKYVHAHKALCVLAKHLDHVGWECKFQLLKKLHL